MPDLYATAWRHAAVGHHASVGIPMPLSVSIPGQGRVEKRLFCLRKIKVLADALAREM